MFEKAIYYIFTFFFFSCIGWTVECTYRSLGERRVINSGFLHGPMCPIYGSGVLVFEVILVPLSQPFEKRWWVTLLVGIIAADTVEYITSFLMEKLFHARWWDYSNNFLNIKGRICFKHSCYWAIAAFVYTYVVSPLYATFQSFIPHNIKLIIVCGIFVVFLFDLTLTVRAAVDVQKMLVKLDNLKQLLYLGGETIRNGAEEVRGNAESAYAELQKTIAENGEKFSEWRGDVSAKYEEFKAGITRKTHGEKSERNSRETSRLLGAYGELRDRISENMKQIEDRLRELRGEPSAETIRDEGPDDTDMNTENKN